MLIYITRHGESEYNVEDRIGGNPSLTSKGNTYAHSLKDTVEALKINTIYCSTKLRTTQTMLPLLTRELDVKMRPDLEEINAGICEGITYKEMSNRFPDEYAKRKKDKLGYRYQDGESYHDVITRVGDVVQEILREKNDTLVICHRAITRAILVQLGVISEEEAPRFDVPLDTILVVQPNTKNIKKIEV